MRGPKPTPTAIRLLKGNPGRRPLNEREPKARPATLDPPTWLKGVAVAEWQRIAPILNRLGILTEVDDIALAAYCQTYARWRDSDAKIDEFGPVIKGKGGFPMISPFFTVSLRTLAQMRAFLIEFGMTPSARSRVRTPTEETDDPFAEFDLGRLERWSPGQAASD